MSSDPVRAVHLVAGEDGESHFVDVEVEMTARDFAPPAAPLDVSTPEAAAATLFFRAPPGWDGQQHPAPARQWAIILEGQLEAEASDGEVRRFGPGDRVLLTDTTGRGHTTRVVGDEPGVGLFVQVPE